MDADFIRAMAQKVVSLSCFQKTLFRFQQANGVGNSYAFEDKQEKQPPAKRFDRQSARSGSSVSFRHACVPSARGPVKFIQSPWRRLMMNRKSTPIPEPIAQLQTPG